MIHDLHNLDLVSQSKCYGRRQELASLLKRDQEDAALGSLAKVVHRKTGGNAFFVLHLIQYLHEQKLVSFLPWHIAGNRKKRLFASKLQFPKTL